VEPSAVEARNWQAARGLHFGTIILSCLYLSFATPKGWRIYHNTHLSSYLFLHVLLIDRFCYIENIYLVLLVSGLQANAWILDLKIGSASEALKLFIRILITGETWKQTRV